MTSWSEAVDAPWLERGVAEVPDASGQEVDFGDSAEGAGAFSRWRARLARTRAALAGELSATVGIGSAASWERIEELLIAADLGAAQTAKLVGELELENSAAAPPGDIEQQLATRLAALARSAGPPTLELTTTPGVVLIVGVNGTGKTTTAAKLAYRLSQLGATPVLGAGDTFRAAGGEQLELWANRSGIEVVGGRTGSDPAAVAFDAVHAAAKHERGVAVIDTAGRIHTRANLMDELAKIRRVIEKQVEGAPAEVLLTIDAGTGQNGLRQAEEFRGAAGITGVVLTKLDGSARGGAALSVADRLGVPLKLVGVGEQIGDLAPFDADNFARALVSGEGGGGSASGSADH